MTAGRFPWSRSQGRHADRIDLPDPEGSAVGTGGEPATERGTVAGAPSAAQLDAAEHFLDNTPFDFDRLDLGQLVDLALGLHAAALTFRSAYYAELPPTTESRFLP